MIESGMRIFIYATLSMCMVLACLGAIPGAARHAEATEPDSVTFFAAASTTNAVTDIGKLFEAKTKAKVVLSFASSSTLARQIEHGAPANVYLSANVKWMDYLSKRGLIVPGSRVDLLANRIVLIAPRDSNVTMDLRPDFPISKLLGDGRLVMGDPDHVPAGMYGKEALIGLGLWKAVEPRLARAKDVRAALALVERGEAVLGVVYSTDAAISKKVRVVAVVPERYHSPIVYPAALVAGNETPIAKRLLAFLKSPEAAAIFKKYGFAVP